MRKIDIIIPVYKPDQKFLALVDKLEHQTVAVNKIIIMNTERQYFDRLVKGTSFFEKYQNVCVINLKKEDFDHGLTRRQGVEQSDAQVFVMMTMDAMPVDEDLVEKLTAPLEREDVAVSYGINHILIKNGAADKSPQPVINIPSVCGAYIGAEKSFYS